MARYPPEDLDIHSLLAVTELQEIHLLHQKELRNLPLYPVQGYHLSNAKERQMSVAVNIHNESS